MAEVHFSGKELAIDEYMVLWRKYTEIYLSKCHKYGIKLCVLVEPTDMIQKILVYGGFTDPVGGGNNHSQKRGAYSNGKKKGIRYYPFHGKFL